MIKYSAIIAIRLRTAPTKITAIASTNTTNSPNGAKLNIVVIFMVSIFFIAYANIVNTFDFYKFYRGKVQKLSIMTNNLSKFSNTTRIIDLSVVLLNKAKH